MLPPCGLRPSLGFIRVCLMLYWGSPDWVWHLTTASFPRCLIPFCLRQQPREWSFCVAESVPVPVNGSDLEAQVMANPSGVCHASRLCLPLPCLRCWDTFSASSMVSPHGLCPWAYWDPASHEKLVAWYLMT
jgi:hypothetical protein